MPYRTPDSKFHVVRLWLKPGMGVKRHVVLLLFATLLIIFGFILFFLWLSTYNNKLFAEPLKLILHSDSWKKYGSIVSFLIFVLGLFFSSISIARLNKSLLSHWKPTTHNPAKVISSRLNLAKGTKIVALGGGTGLSNLLRGLRKYSSNITAVVAVSDDGGSSGRLRTAFDMPAPGDISDCLAALSDHESQVSALMQYRFKRGDELKGHTFGNLLITTLTEVEGDFEEAINSMNSLLALTGKVYPATPEPVVLKAVKETGDEITGESKFAKKPGAVREVRLEPSQPKATKEVLAAIFDADLIILGPGSLFTSTIPPLLVPAIAEAIVKSNAELIYIANIMTELGETDGMSVFEHVRAIYNHLGRYPDRLIVNSSPVDSFRLEQYQKESAEVSIFDINDFKDLSIKITELPLLSHGQLAQHDSDKLAEWLASHAKHINTNKKG